ncbi:uncharacterized protein LOC110064281 [Orbicella faveolata]|uniref:uncharacterized protein LOC110064281 n=1 Tax=Orbicella faveolata TaxID=48498 RepID=UPI0009E53896|nr:uncharacterized protein LOC110064281 [Orbicella faveolata]
MKQAAEKKTDSNWFFKKVSLRQFSLRKAAKVPQPRLVTRLKGVNTSPKVLKFDSKKQRIVWQKKEDVALAQFVALHKNLQRTKSEWPSLNPKSKYWKDVLITSNRQLEQSISERDHQSANEWWYTGKAIIMAPSTLAPSIV